MQFWPFRAFPAVFRREARPITAVAAWNRQSLLWSPSRTFQASLRTLLLPLLPLLPSSSFFLLHLSRNQGCSFLWLFCCSDGPSSARPHHQLGVYHLTTPRPFTPNKANCFRPLSIPLCERRVGRQHPVTRLRLQSPRAEFGGCILQWTLRPQIPLPSYP